MTSSEFMTKDGLERLKAQLQETEQKLADLRMHKGTEAIYAGDMWHDNPTFREVESQERALMRAIIELKQRIKNARLIDIPTTVTTVIIGCEVEVRFSDGEVETYRILGHADSDPLSGVLSYKSPLGAALLGKKVGDIATYSVNGQVEKVKITRISAIDPNSTDQSTNVSGDTPIDEAQ